MYTIFPHLTMFQLQCLVVISVEIAKLQNLYVSDFGGTFNCNGRKETSNNITARKVFIFKTITKNPKTRHQEMLTI